MAGKPSGGNSGKQANNQTVKTSLQLSAIAAARLAGLVAATGLQQSAVVAAAVENYVSRLGADKRAVVQAVITARIGRSTASVETDAVMAAPAEGESRGRGSDILPADRLQAFSRINARAASPIDSALESMG